MREIFIIYHGLGMAGKTTNIEILSSVFKDLKIDRFHQSTSEGRTVYLDTLLISVRIKGSDEHIKIRIFSTPGQERFSIVRPWIFSNADGFVFVVDPTQSISDNLRAYKEIEDYTNSVPVVIQINKRDIAKDLTGFMEVFRGKNVILACAKTGDGVKETFLSVLKEVIENGVAK